MTIQARFDGRVFVPVGPVSLEPGTIVEIPVPQDAASPAKPVDVAAKPAATPDNGPPRFLADILRIAEEFPDNPDWPTDGAAQVDHYLYGTPKRP